MTLQEVISHQMGTAVQLENVALSELHERIIGIYFLMRDGVCVYIGQSIHVLERIEVHFREATYYLTGIEPKLFDVVCYVRCNLEDLDRLEIAFLRQLKPEYNVAGGGGNGRGRYDDLETREPMFAAKRHHERLQKMRDIAYGFLLNTDEESVEASDLRDR